jgi:hypothetical protein
MNGLFKLSDKTYTLGIRHRGGDGGDRGGVCGGGGGYPRLLICLYWQSYFPLNTFNHTRNPLKVYFELSPPLSSNIHTEKSYFHWFINSDRTYIPKNVISLGLQTLNPQQNYLPLKTQTSDYHYQETSKTHTSLYHNLITSTKDDKNDHDTT